MSLLLRRHHKKVEQEEVVEVVESEEVDYEELTVPELKELADEREINYKANITKPDLIELLQ
jgi:hypothetical protein